MDFYFSKMKVFKRNKQFSLRLRCLMADVLDLRCAKWIPRIKTEGPTIEQVLFFFFLFSFPPFFLIDSFFFQIHQDAKLKKTKKETRSLSRNDRVRPFNSTKTSRSDSQKVLILLADVILLFCYFVFLLFCFLFLIRSKLF